MFFSRFFLSIALLSCGSSVCVDEAKSELCIGFIEMIASIKGLEGLKQLSQQFPGQEDIMREILDGRREQGTVCADFSTEAALYDFHTLLPNRPKPE